MRQHNLYRQQCSIYLFLQVGGVNAIEFKHTVVMRDQIRDAGIVAERDRLFKMKIAGNISAAPVLITSVDGQQGDIRLQVP